MTFSGGDDDDEPPVIEIGDDAGSVDLGIESLEMPTLAAPSADETVELSVGDDSGTLVLKE